VARRLSVLIDPTAGKVTAIAGTEDCQAVSGRVQLPAASQNNFQICSKRPYRSLNPRLDRGTAQPFVQARSTLAPKRGRTLMATCRRVDRSCRTPRDSTGRLSAPVFRRNATDAICRPRRCMKPVFWLRMSRVGRWMLAAGAVAYLLDDVQGKIALPCCFITHDLRVAAQIF